MSDEAKRRIEGLERRAEMMSAPDGEITKQLESERARASSTPAPAKGIVAVLSVIPAWQRGIVLLALLGLVGYAVGHGFKFW